MPGPTSTTSGWPRVLVARVGTATTSVPGTSWSSTRTASTSVAAAAARRSWPGSRRTWPPHADAHVLAYWHHPRFSSRVDPASLAVRPFWEALYDAGADIVLSGHSHRLRTLRPAGSLGPTGPDARDPGLRGRHRGRVAPAEAARGCQQRGLRLRPWRAAADAARRQLRLGLRADRRRPLHRCRDGTPHGPPPARSSATFTAHTDTWVDQGAPNATHAASPVLRVDGNHGGGDDYRSYLKVRVTGLVGAVYRATLRLWVSNPTRDGPYVWRTSTAWSSRTLTWRNRPGPIGAMLDDAGPVSSGGWRRLRRDRGRSRATGPSPSCSARPRATVSWHRPSRARIRPAWSSRRCPSALQAPRWARPGARRRARRGRGCRAASSPRARSGAARQERR